MHQLKKRHDKIITIYKLLKVLNNPFLLWLPHCSVAHVDCWTLHAGGRKSWLLVTLYSYNLKITVHLQ